MATETVVENKLKINGREVTFGGERNLLEVIRKAGINLPTFCYRPDLSIYGSCRLCLVEVEGKGVTAACSSMPEPGMSILTDTAALRKLRKINIELLLANHDCECPSCLRSGNCELQKLARELGVTEIRYKRYRDFRPVDTSSPSLIRTPNKCILCGNCIRACREIQSVGALDFAGRGSSVRVAPAFVRGLGESECVNCGQCARVCPTGAIVPKPDWDGVWSAVHDKTKTVAVQIAPAVRVALGERFGMGAGENVAGKMVTALRMMGFDRVYDTSYAADMTIFEEATELLERVAKKQTMPMFTSCCPGWVKFLETFYPEYRDNLSTTRSPQQIFGTVMRKVLPVELNVAPEKLVTVSIMPCTAKKYEAKLPKFQQNGRPDVDYVLTTIELANMIESMGIDLSQLEDGEFDMPLALSTGSGVIFGATGGVMEAALRFAVEKISGKPLENIEFHDVRGDAPRKEATVEANGLKVRVAVVHGLGNARLLLDEMKAGNAAYDFIEVMACPGGCVNGGGQPINLKRDYQAKRSAGLYTADQQNPLRKSQDNYEVAACYAKYLGGKPGSHEAHEALHTYYQNRDQVFAERISLILTQAMENKVSVCVSLSADQKESEAARQLISLLGDMIRDAKLEDSVRFDAVFTHHANPADPMTVTVGDKSIEAGTTPQERANAVIAEIIRQK